MTSTDFWIWFEAQIDRRFPDKASLLPCGASTKAIKQAESRMRIEFPSEVKDFYKRHNGSGPFCFHPWIIGGGAHWFVSLDQVASTWKTMCKVGEEFERTEPDYGFGTRKDQSSENTATHDGSQSRKINAETTSSWILILPKEEPLVRWLIGGTREV